MIDRLGIEALSSLSREVELIKQAKGTAIASARRALHEGVTAEQVGHTMGLTVEELETLLKRHALHVKPF